MSYRLLRVLMCDSAECTEAPDTAALIAADAANLDVPEGWHQDNADPAGPRHLCPTCLSMNRTLPPPGADPGRFPPEAEKI